MADSNTLTLFYSWQSDLPGATNRGFIRTALENVAKNLNRDTEVEERVTVDSDTANVPGSPDIVATIFEKIKRSDIFICDVSIVGLLPLQEPRPTPNPNVLIELGYALATLSTDRIIMVMNTAFGPPKLLPFDLSHLRVTGYSMPLEEQNRSSARKDFERLIEARIREILGSRVTEAEVTGELSLRDKVIAAIENNQSSDISSVKDFMKEITQLIQKLTPPLTNGNLQQQYETFLTALEAPETIVLDFAQIADAISRKNSHDFARAVYKSFEFVFKTFNVVPNSGITSWRQSHFDLCRFVGYELFVAFFSFLIRDERWDIITDLLDEGIYIPNAPNGQAAKVPFEYGNQTIILLEDYNGKFGERSATPVGTLLVKRHNDGRIAEIVPLQQFMDADFFLFLRSAFRQSDPLLSYRWVAWSAVALHKPPRYLIEATDKKYAITLANALNIQEVDRLRQEFDEKRAKLVNMFTQNNLKWILTHSARWSFDPNAIGSQG